MGQLPPGGYEIASNWLYLNWVGWKQSFHDAWPLPPDGAA